MHFCSLQRLEGTSNIPASYLKPAASIPHLPFPSPFEQTDYLPVTCAASAKVKTDRAWAAQEPRRCQIGANHQWGGTTLNPQVDLETLGGDGARLPAGVSLYFTTSAIKFKALGGENMDKTIGVQQART